jgi:hypothetical protein
MPSRLKLRGQHGLIDAEFTVRVTGSSSFDIVLESAGGPTGGRSPRNPQYTKGLEELLRRASEIASTLDDCVVVSRATQALPTEERRVPPEPPYSYPIPLRDGQDFDALRRALTGPQRRVASHATTGGNQRKNIAMSFTARQPGLTVADIVTALRAEPSGTLRRKDIAEGLRREDIDAAIAEWREMGPDAFHRKFGTRGAAKFVIAGPNGDEYDAKAILFGARSRAGLDGNSADFDGDRRTVADPLVNLGYVVEDIARPEDDLTPPRALTDEEKRQRAIAQARAFEGETDGTVERKARREQRILRRALGLGNSSHECAICGRTYPDRLLVAAHIKKRSECSHSEKTDIPTVAMIVCALGCDALFENGYVVVSNDGIITSTPRAHADPHLAEVVSAIEGRHVSGWDASRRYFDWHRGRWG